MLWSVYPELELRKSPTLKICKPTSVFATKAVLSSDEKAMSTEYPEPEALGSAEPSKASMIPMRDGAERVEISRTCTPIPSSVKRAVFPSEESVKT